MGYEVVDSRTGDIVRVFAVEGRAAQNMRAAYRLADRMDAEYGAVRYVVRRRADTWGAAVLAVGAL